MAISIGDALLKLGVDSSELDSGMKKATNDIKAQMKTAGIALTGFGAAVTGVLGLSAKAAMDEEINIKRLATTMENVGVSYDKVKDSLEAVIATTQRKTGVADNEQRDILNRLILTTGDYATSLELLPTVLDLAAAGEMDATTAATYLGKAHNDLAAGAETVSVRFGQASLQFKSMADIQDRVKGSAENLVNPFDVLKASIGDVSEVIGSFLLPIIKEVIDKVVDVAEKIQAWIKEHSNLAKLIVIVAGAMGLLSLALGTSLLLFPPLIAGWNTLHLSMLAHKVAAGVATAAQWLWNAALTANPIGIVIVAIGALIAAGIALWKNWDKVKDFFEGLWINMKIIFAEGVKFIINTVLLPFIEFWGKYIGIIITGVGKIVGVFNKDLGDAIEGVGKKFLNARQELTAWADDLAEGARVEKSIRETEKALKDTEEALADTTEITKEHTEATDVDTEALIANTEALVKQKAELIDKIEKTRKEFEYERSAAGRLRISIKDVTFALFDLGWTNERITQTLEELGDEADDVNALLAAVGLTALEVKNFLDEQRDSVDALTDSYKKLSTTPTTPAISAGITPGMFGVITPEEAAKGAHMLGGPGYYSETHLAAQAASMASQGYNPAQIAFAIGAMTEGMPTYQYGGPIIEDTLLMGLKSMRPYAVAHKGERVSPDRTANITIILDGKVIGRAIGQPLIDEIRVKTGVRI